MYSNSLDDQKNRNDEVDGNRRRWVGLGPVIVGVVLLALLFANGWRKFKLAGPIHREQQHEERLDKRLYDPNSADLKDLSLIPGLGPALAAKLVEFRLRRTISKPSDLLNVPGIGPAIVQKVKPWFQWKDEQGSGESASTKDESRNMVLSDRTDKLKPGDTPININGASLEELQKLPGVGPVLARRILDERGKKPFSSIDDLMRVSGIGSKTIVRIRAVAIVSEIPKNQIQAE
jgi:competence protein ComEA